MRTHTFKESVVEHGSSSSSGLTDGSVPTGEPNTAGLLLQNDLETVDELISRANHILEEFQEELVESEFAKGEAEKFYMEEQIKEAEERIEQLQDGIGTANEAVSLLKDVKVVQAVWMLKHAKDQMEHLEDIQREVFKSTDPS